MRLSITFGIGEGSTIPVNYNHLLVGLIYGILQNAAPDWSKVLHDHGHWSSDDRPFKLFTFSQLRGGPGTTKVENGRLVFVTKRLEWKFASPADGTVEMLAGGLLRAGTVSIGSMRAKVESVKNDPMPDFSEGKARLVAISPIVASVSDPVLRHRYLSPDTDEFWSILGENLSRKWESFRGSRPERNITLHPDIAYIQRKRTSKVITIKPGEIVIGHMVPFEAEGDPEILRFAYETGFGSRNSMGFGMVNIAH